MDIIENIDRVDVVDAEYIGVPRQIFVRKNYFDLYTDEMFFRRFRIRKLIALSIVLDQIEHRLQYYT